jgi:hypothetical protein
MKTFKKILKYISLLIGILILVWLSYGFYLYANLPDIEIENKEHKTSFSSIADKSNLPIAIDSELVVKTLLPKDKLFNSQIMSILTKNFKHPLDVLEDFYNQVSLFGFLDWSYVQIYCRLSKFIDNNL